MRPMLATKGDVVPMGDEWSHEVKWDGVRMLADVQEGADRALAAEHHQQRIADDHGRQDQGQVHQGIEQRLAREATACQQPGHRDACRQAGDGRGDGHFQAEGDRCQFGGAEVGHRACVRRLSAG